MGGLDVVPSDECDLFVRGDEDSFVVPEEVANHGRPPIGECAGLSDEGEVRRVSNAVGVYTTVHLSSMKVI